MLGEIISEFVQCADITITLHVRHVLHLKIVIYVWQSEWWLDGNSYSLLLARLLFLLLPSSRFGSTRWLGGFYFGIVSNTIVCHFFHSCSRWWWMFFLFFFFHLSTSTLYVSQVKFANACIKTILPWKWLSQFRNGSRFVSFHFVCMQSMHCTYLPLVVNCVNFKFK